jgi:hypothetical protein
VAKSRPADAGLEIPDNLALNLHKCCSAVRKRLFYWFPRRPHPYARVGISSTKLASQANLTMPYSTGDARRNHLNVRSVHKTVTILPHRLIDFEAVVNLALT